MLDPGLLELKGARAETKYTSLATIKFLSGLQTQRSPFAGIDTRYGTRFMGGKPDALIAGSNVEISNRLTLVRRPGLTQYGNASIPPPLFFYEWEEVAPFSLDLLVDTAPSIYRYTPTFAGIWLDKANGSGQTTFANLANTVYLGDGVDLYKIVGPNLLFQSSTFTDPVWAKANVSVAPGFADPTGGSNAAQLTPAIASSLANIQQTVVPNYLPVPSNTFTFSIWLSQPLAYGAETITLELVDQVNSVVATQTFEMTMGWARYQITGTTSAGLSTSGQQALTVILSSPSLLSPILIYGAQLEVGGPAKPTEITTIKPQGLYKWGIVAPTSAPGLSYGPGQPFLINIASITQPPPMGISEIIEGVPLAGQVNASSQTVPPNTYEYFGFLPGALLTVSGTVNYNSTGNVIQSLSPPNSTPTFVVVGYTPVPAPHAQEFTGTMQSQLTTVVTQTPHGLKSGDSVTLSNTGVAAYNGTQTVFSVLDLFTFTFNASSAGNATVTGTGKVTTATDNGLSPAVGFTYYYAFLNSTTGMPSNVSPKAFTGPISDKTITLTGSGSTDPQVDEIAIYRNVDGGAFFYQLATVSNPGAGMWTFTDALLGAGEDANFGLNTQIFAPIGFLNTPPPAGLVDPVSHVGRFFGHVGSKLYYSTSTDNAAVLNIALNAVTAEAWLPSNVIPFDAPITRKESTSAGLLVWTVKDLWLVTGAVITDPFTPVRILKGHGLRSYNAMDVDGSTLYAYMSDRQFVNINPGVGSLEVGFPIGDLLEGVIDPTQAYVARHVSGSQDNACYLADGSSGWFRLNPNQVGASLSGEQTELWSPFATIAGGCGAVASVETSSGVHQLLVGQTGPGPVLTRSLAAFTDNGALYSWSATIGSIVLATAGQLAETESITTEMTQGSTQASVAVLLDEISGTFESLPAKVNDPPQLIASASLKSNRFYLSQGPTPPICRHLQIRLTGAASATPDELLSLSIRGTLVPEEV